MILYSYCRSSAAYRVRIALNIKGMSYQLKPVHLVQNGGEHHHPEFHALNPQELLPVLTHNTHTFSQSLAIIEYLESVQSNPSLFPNNTPENIACREIALSISCDIHPLNNLRVLNFLKNKHQLEKNDITHWYQHWITEGFLALEETLLRHHKNHGGPFCFGEQPTLADICLIPQCYNARRFHVDFSPYPTIYRIAQHCDQQAEFIEAAPEQQPDFPVG